MNSNNKTKLCPSCRTPKSLDGGKKILSRSAGKSTASWRCNECLEKMRKAKTSS